MPASTPAAPAVLRIAMNGVTGRMGYRQHLLRSILPLRDAGGIQLADGTRIAVEPILVGRNQAKITELAELHKIEHWSTDLDAVIADPTVDVVFDASMTASRSVVQCSTPCRRASSATLASLRPTRIGSTVTRVPSGRVTPPWSRMGRIERSRCWR